MTAAQLMLRPRQWDTFKAFKANKRFLDRSHAGTGKTPPACVYTRYMVKNQKKKVIWIQPTSLMRKNLEELQLWTGLGDRVVEVTGAKLKKDATILRRDVDVWIMTAEALKTYGTQMFRQHNIGLIICDEPHLYYVGFTSARTQAFYGLTVKYPELEVKFLTATPTPKGKLTSAYIYCSVIQPDYYRGFNYFKSIHQQDDGFGNIEWINYPILHKFLEHYSICHTTKEMYGEIPQYIVRHRLDLPAKLRRFYDRFEAEGILEMKSSILQDMPPSVNTLRCRQILNHPHQLKLPVVYDADNNPVAWEHVEAFTGLTPKQEAIINYVNEGEPLFIIATFHEEQEQLVRLIEQHCDGVKVGLINGTVSKAKRDEIDAGFRNGTVDVIVASGQTTSVGYNWQHLNTIIFHSVDYGDDIFYQAVQRAKRGKRDTPLRIVVLEYKSTIEAYLLLKVHQASVRSNAVNRDFEVIHFPKVEGDTPDMESLWD